MSGGVIDRIYVEGLCANARVQGVDECLPGRAEAGWIVGAAGEHHLHVRARIGGGDGDGGCEDRSGDA
jgi:hypothetical protein